MKKMLLAAAIGLLFLQTSRAQALPETFSDLLTRADMTYSAPEGYTSVEPVDNPHMLYNYALKHATEKFEIRYAVHPMDESLKMYEEVNASGGKMINPNDYFPAVAVAASMNISNRIFGSSPMPDDFANKYFNGDSGIYCLCEPKADFAKGYAFCTMVSVFKRDKAYAYYFFLFDDDTTLKKLFNSDDCHSLKFK